MMWAKYFPGADEVDVDEPLELVFMAGFTCKATLKSSRKDTLLAGTV